MRASILLLTVGLASGQMTAPRLGYIADAGGLVHPVLGLPGNLWLGDSVTDTAISTASSGSFTLVKTDPALLLLDGQGQIQSRLQTDSGPALFAFSSALPALAYLPRTFALFAWRTDHFEPSASPGDSLGGAPESIAAITPGIASFLVRRTSGLWRVDLSMNDGLVILEKALNLEGPVLLTFDGSLIYTQEGTLLIRASGGLERHVDLGCTPASLSQMGSGWLHVREKDSSRQFVVRISVGREQVWQLPEAQ